MIFSMALGSAAAAASGVGINLNNSQRTFRTCPGHGTQLSCQANLDCAALVGIKMQRPRGALLALRPAAAGGWHWHVISCTFSQTIPLQQRTAALLSNACQARPRIMMPACC